MVNSDGRGGWLRILLVNVNVNVNNCAAATVDAVDVCTGPW